MTQRRHRTSLRANPPPTGRSQSTTLRRERSLKTTLQQERSPECEPDIRAQRSEGVAEQRARPREDPMPPRHRRIAVQPERTECLLGPLKSGTISVRAALAVNPPAWPLRLKRPRPTRGETSTNEAAVWTCKLARGARSYSLTIGPTSAAERSSGRGLPSPRTERCNTILNSINKQQRWSLIIATEAFYKR